MKKITVLLITLMLFLILAGTVIADSDNDQNNFADIGEPTEGDADFNFEDLNVAETLTEEISAGGENEVDNSFGLLISFVILIILIGLLFLASKDMLPKTKKEKRIALRKDVDAKDLDKYAKQVLDLLKKRGNRLTQKEIRGEITEIGEVKISLIIAELEAIGKVKIIKRGRGNIIILKKANESTQKLERF